MKTRKQPLSVAANRPLPDGGGLIVGVVAGGLFWIGLFALIA